MNKELIQNLNSLKQVLTLGMITESEYKVRFANLMNNHNAEYKRAARNIKH
ncbi:hypothetical protein [uncultured Mediterranean phage uvMED]|nr:hypothetical protein [uncultured Mediterranean phage uvMED]